MMSMLFPVMIVLFHMMSVLLPAASVKIVKHRVEEWLEIHDGLDGVEGCWTNPATRLCLI